MKRATKDSIVRKIQPYDHIVWEGQCRRCGSSRYVFIEEVRAFGKGNNVDLRDEELECKGKRCKGKARVKRRIPGFKAIHLSNIRNREGDLNTKLYSHAKGTQRGFAA